MNYSAASIANLALNRIGARGQITSLSENSPNAVKVNTVWDAIFQEVLSERDWKFAKTRTALSLISAVPQYTWKHAWALPGDFLRFVRPQKRPQRHHHGFFWGWSPEGWGWYHREDPPFWPLVDFKVEQVLTGNVNGVPTYQKCCVTNFDGCNGTFPAQITYIQLITDYTQLMPGFVNCLAFRLAMELSIGVTEDKQKFQLMAEGYKEALNSAEAQNETQDLVSFDEQGSTSWEDAGRIVRYW